MLKIKAISPNILAMETKKHWYDNVFSGVRRWWRWGSTDIFRKIFFMHTNRITAKSLARHLYWEIDSLMFHCMFQLLVDYVEEQCAAVHLISLGKLKWYHTYFPIKNGRPLGLAHLDWEIQLGEDSPSQSKSAQEIKELYLWYKDEYPNTPDPFDILPDEEQVFTELPDGMYEMMPSSDEYQNSLKIASNQDEINIKFEQNQLIRLVKLRHYMWT